MERLTPTFELAVEIFLLGCNEKIKQGEDDDETEQSF